MSCSTCNHLKSDLKCGLCEAELCKACTEFVDDERLSFLPTKPPALTHHTFCQSCFVSQVLPELENYDATLEAAKNILVFEKKQSKETRLVSKKEKPLTISNCKDHDEAIMRMAFQAVQLGFNALVKVKMNSKKVKDGAYTSLLWSGEAIPAHVDEARLPKDKSLWHHPN